MTETTDNGGSFGRSGETVKMAVKSGWNAMGSLPCHAHSSARSQSLTKAGCVRVLRRGEGRAGFTSGLILREGEPGITGTQQPKKGALKWLGDVGEFDKVTVYKEVDWTERVCRCCHWS